LNTLAGFATGMTAELLAAGGIVIYSLGQSLMTSSWFALLSPVVPLPMRGRFFGNLRLTWQLTGCAFAALCGLMLSGSTDASRYQLMLLAITTGQAIRIVFYSRIPELEETGGSRRRMMEVVGEAIRLPGYLSFGAYCFLLLFFVSNCPVLFAMVEKDVLHLSDTQVVWLGGSIMVGAVVGFRLVGRLIDTYGTKPIFLFCHVGFGAVLALFLTRAAWPWDAGITVGAASFLYGIISAASYVAATTELMALVPAGANRSVKLAVGRMLQVMGPGLSGLAISGVLKTNMLAESWQLGQLTLSRYDAILFCFAAMIVMLTVTLGLVPSVLRRHEDGAA
jgi:MFS family permease